MILVTGGTGLVGSHLLYQLCKQHDKVFAIYRKNSDLEAVKHVFSYYSDTYEAIFKNIKWIEADISDIVSLSKAFEGITYVYHCAALVSFDSTDYLSMRKINIEGTANIVNLSISNSVHKICFVSSIAAVGKSLTGEEITESNDWNIEENNYGYAITKYGAEMEVWRASQEGIDVVIVNPGIIIGPGFWNKGSGKLFTSVYSGLKFYTEGVTAFVAVTDVVNTMIQLMKSSIVNERYILVSESISFKNILFNIADGLHKKRPSIKISKFTSSIFWRFEWILLKLFGRKPTLTKHSAKAAHNKYYYTNTKIKETLNYNFKPIKKVLEDTCGYFLNDY